MGRAASSRSEAAVSSRVGSEEYQGAAWGQGEAAQETGGNRCWEGQRSEVSRYTVQGTCHLEECARHHKQVEGKGQGEALQQQVEEHEFIPS